MKVTYNVTFRVGEVTFQIYYLILLTFKQGYVS